MKKKYDRKKPPILYHHTQGFLKKRSAKIEKKTNSFAKKPKKDQNEHFIPFDELSNGVSMQIQTRQQTQ